MKVLTASCFCLILPTLFVSAQLASPLHRLPTTDLLVHSTDGARVHFRTVVAQNLEDLRQGLMHVKHLPANQTMLFLYNPPRPASMWMKNTHISLDMWWLDAGWRIVHIESNTTPLSLASLSFDQPVRAVLETNAGLSKTLGISIGDRVEVALQ